MRLRLAYRRYTLPFRIPVRTAHGVWAEREGIIMRLSAEDGRTGYGEAAPIPWFGTETIEEIEAVLSTLGEWVTTEQLNEVPARLGCLRFAVAESLGEFEAKNLKAEAEARSSSRPPAVVSLPEFLPVAALLPAGRAALTAIGPKAELGFRTFKWKVGVGDLADELSLLDDVIAALPDRAKLRLDANGAWEARQAVRWLERAADRPIEFIEQ
ncbi:MAG: o-succinylbenzoate synthase, partial [Rariglobus sp.]